MKIPFAIPSTPEDAKLWLLAIKSELVETEIARAVYVGATAQEGGRDTVGLEETLPYAFAAIGKQLADIERRLAPEPAVDVPADEPAEPPTPPAPPEVSTEPGTWVALDYAGTNSIIKPTYILTPEEYERQVPFMALPPRYGILLAIHGRDGDCSDQNVHVTRYTQMSIDEFERRASPWLSRWRTPIQDAMYRELGKRVNPRSKP